MKPTHNSKVNQIEARTFAYTDNPEKIAKWCKGKLVMRDFGNYHAVEFDDEYSGHNVAEPGDYIVKYPNGMFKALKPAVFNALYEIA